MMPNHHADHQSSSRFNQRMNPGRNLGNFKFTVESIFRLNQHNLFFLDAGAHFNCEPEGYNHYAGSSSLDFRGQPNLDSAVQKLLDSFQLDDDNAGPSSADHFESNRREDPINLPLKFAQYDQTYRDVPNNEVTQSMFVPCSKQKAQKKVVKTEKKAAQAFNTHSHI